MSAMSDRNKDLTAKELTVVEVLPNNNTDSNTSDSNSFCLVGRLYTTKQPNGFHLMEVMKKAWKAKKDMVAREWSNNLFVFTFKNRDDREWVLKNQPWHFENHLFAITSLMGNEQPSTMVVDRCSFWIRAYDLPISCMNSTTATAIAARIGNLEEVDRSESYTGSFLRFKVNIELTDPLLRGVMLRLPDRMAWIPLKYEHLPIYCFNCGIIGHQIKQCQERQAASDNNFDDLRYGVWIKASPLKRIRSTHTNTASSHATKSLFRPKITPSDPSHIHDLTIPSTQSENTTVMPALSLTYIPPHLRKSLPPSSTKPSTTNKNKSVIQPHPESEPDFEPDLLPTQHSNPHFDDPTVKNPPAIQQSAPVIGIGTEAKNFRDLSRPTFMAENLPLSTFVESVVSHKKTKKRKSLVDEADLVNNSELANMDGSDNEEVQRMHKKLKQSGLLVAPIEDKSTAEIALKQSRRSQ